MTAPLPTSMHFSDKRLRIRPECSILPGWAAAGAAAAAIRSKARISVRCMASSSCPLFANSVPLVYLGRGRWRRRRRLREAALAHQRPDTGVAAAKGAIAVGRIDGVADLEDM